MKKQEFIEKYKNNIIKDIEALKLHKQFFEEFIEKDGDLKKTHTHLRCDICPLFCKCPSRKKMDTCIKTIKKEVE